MAFETPVAFLIFNRPDLTEIVFKAIAKIKPRKLFVIGDGPRFPEEEEKCQKARAVIDKINWDCEVLTDFLDINLGCGQRVSSGFDWVFSQVEEAIFLEDDTLPTPSFFNFCQQLLEKYRYDERIRNISGHNFQPQSRTNDTYYFSKYIHSWGWASWRRAWKYYDYHMKAWPAFKKQGFLANFCEDSYEQTYWTKIFDRMYSNPKELDTWDYQWHFACISQNGLTIVPNSNLVSNIGFGHPDSTHTFAQEPWANSPTVDIGDLKHPQFIVRHKEADAYTFDYVCGGNSLRASDTLLWQIRQRLSELKRKLKYPAKLLGTMFSTDS